MATLVLDNRSLELRIDGPALALYEHGERRGSLPLKLLERLILQGDLTLSAGVLTRLAENGTAVLMLSKRHNRRLALVLGPAHNDAAIRIAQAQRVTDSGWCALWARRQIEAKSRAQLRLLKNALDHRPDYRKPLSDAITSIERLLERIDAAGQPPSTESLRGIEGAAAHAYFQGFASLFPPSLGFSGRNRRPPRDPVNACLSLAYTLLHFEAVRAAHMAGLDPLLGFYHRPAIGRESLASDLIEPLRPHTDGWVWQLFRERTLRLEHFNREGETCLLGKAGREIFYQHYEAHAKPVRRMLRRQCRVLATHLRAQGGNYLEQAEA